MPWFEILGFEALELIVLAYFVIGSYSLGYLLLRTAQPKVRILEENYRIGWSIIFGLFFSILWLATSIALGMQALFPVVLTITLIIALIALSLRRRFFASRKLNVAIPKERALAQIVSEKSVDQLLSDKQFILNKSLSSEQVEKIRESLKKREGDSVGQ
ncbi:MAG: hypothetical protein J4478_01170 [Candidatus Diapherotrites archaeon]|uniref:Uncharacterized protein n=1 Tax=Candidatus Iainarchaeum sp. TaxID=3101447 RepID=A0A7J4KXI9_9ARCH|nr:MAG: hypothetical protein QT12_C0016G0003 [archaeon GW2011_AR21]MBS3057995.1 hypothetical protein [Candidatus Diapherotrites archaeon]HIH32997.1 hypothetical protein [Candidatus Diapherotrites archaeon]